MLCHRPHTVIVSAHQSSGPQQNLQELVLDGKEHLVLFSQVIEKSGYQALPWVRIR